MLVLVLVIVLLFLIEPVDGTDLHQVLNDDVELVDVGEGDHIGQLNLLRADHLLNQDVDAVLDNVQEDVALVDLLLSPVGIARFSARCVERVIAHKVQAALDEGLLLKREARVVLAPQLLHGADDLDQLEEVRKLAVFFITQLGNRITRVAVVRVCLFSGCQLLDTILPGNPFLLSLLFSYHDQQDNQHTTIRSKTGKRIAASPIACACSLFL